MSSIAVKTLEYTTTEVTSTWLLPEMVLRVANMLNYFLQFLTGNSAGLIHRIQVLRTVCFWGGRICPADQLMTNCELKSIYCHLISWAGEIGYGRGQGGKGNLKMGRGGMVGKLLQLVYIANGHTAVFISVLACCHSTVRCAYVHTDLHDGVCIQQGQSHRGGVHPARNAAEEAQS